MDGLFFNYLAVHVDIDQTCCQWSFLLKFLPIYQSSCRGEIHLLGFLLCPSTQQKWFLPWMQLDICRPNKPGSGCQQTRQPNRGHYSANTITLTNTAAQTNPTALQKQPNRPNNHNRPYNPNSPTNPTAQQTQQNQQTQWPNVSWHTQQTKQGLLACVGFVGLLGLLVCWVPLVCWICCIC